LPQGGIQLEKDGANGGDDGDAGDDTPTT